MVLRPPAFVDVTKCYALGDRCGQAPQSGAIIGRIDIAGVTPRVSGLCSRPASSASAIYSACVVIWMNWSKSSAPSGLRYLRAPPLNQSPFVPAEAGTQALKRENTWPRGPRFRGDERR